MINLQAKNRILNLYRERPDSYEKVEKDEYKKLFYAIRSHISSDKKEWIKALGEFLCYGACAFDRFVGLRPGYVDDESYNMFCDFLCTLQKLDGDSYGRTYFFYLEKVKWQIFKQCSLLPYNEEMEIFLTQCEENIAKLILPKAEERIVDNWVIKKNEIVELINDIRNGHIRTKIHTSLPSKLTNADATIVLKVQGVNVKVNICNHSQGSSLPGISIKECSAMSVSGPSRWTTTTCELDIDAECLMDGLEYKPSVTLQKKEDNRYWTAAFDFTYRVISALWMYFQQNDIMTGTWPPLPNDIHYIDYCVVADIRKYDFERTTNPSLVYHITSLKKPLQYYEINDALPKWSEYTYHFAKVYAESGQLKESIFWLNVSVEALVEEFIHRTATTKEILAEIEGEEHKFDTAEEILAAQFPEMKGKVKWPDAVIHTSVYTKLKRAIKISNVSGLQKDILKKYSIVNAKRNALFHGSNVDIQIEDIEKAFNSYSWLKEKL